MENKINISKLLKDCPKGMELDCTMFDNLVFCEIDSEVQDYPIITQLPNGVQKWFTSDGRYELNPNAKCVIFPKGKTTWDGFHRPFKDGEVVAYGKLDGKESQIFIFKDKKENNTLSNCYLMLDGDELDIEEGAYYVTRIATEEEKQKLFNAIKAHGYKWNSETKTLEELIETKEDTDNRDVMSGIYFDRENYADEVELHLGNYEIEIRNGNTYAIFKNQKTETLNPKFKVGDRIKHKTNPGQGNEVTEIKDTHYILDYELALPFLYQDQYELITNKFDITSLKKVTQPKFKVGDIIQDIDSYKVKITKVNIECECYGYESTIGKGIGVMMFSKQDEWKLVPNIEPTFKVGDRIKKDKDHISGIITNISDDGSYKVEYQGGGISYVSLAYQDEYELVSDIKPKFKVGDRVRLKLKPNYVYTIHSLAWDDNKKLAYRLLPNNDKHLILVSLNTQDDYELVHNKFDITNLKPFNKVLIRDRDTEEWNCHFFSYYRKNSDRPYICIGSEGMNEYKQCIPYEANKHLLGTNKDCDEYFKTWE